MKVTIDFSQDEIRILEEQTGLTIKNKDDIIYIIHLLLEILDSN